MSQFSGQVGLRARIQLMLWALAVIFGVGAPVHGQVDTDTVSIFAFSDLANTDSEKTDRYQRMVAAVPDRELGIKSMLRVRKENIPAEDRFPILFELYAGADIARVTEYVLEGGLFDSLEYNTYEEIYGRPYVPFVVDSANWITLIGSSNLHYYISGDTLVGDTAYKKLYVAPYYPTASHPNDMFPPYSVGVSELAGLLREDTTERKVYGRLQPSFVNRARTDDTLIHDFSAIALDTVHGVYYFPDSIVRGRTRLDTFGYDRSVLWFDGVEVIEGIGSPFNGPLASGGYFTQEGHYSLIDYCVGSFEACGIDRTTSVRERVRPPTLPVSLYPNPATTVVRIDPAPFPSAGNLRVELFDAQGRQLMDRVFNTDPITLPVSHLPGGVYTVRLQGHGRLASGKFVK